MNWPQVLTLAAEATAQGGAERRVLLELADARFHVKEVITPDVEEGGLLGFVVFHDDPTSSQRTEATRLLFLQPERVLRVVIDAEQEVESGFGFGGT
tara:strand:+ start:246 stop:536 length:291 start_codon:yes stop_codon:yes gene_type:complete